MTWALPRSARYDADILIKVNNLSRDLWRWPPCFHLALHAQSTLTRYAVGVIGLLFVELCWTFNSSSFVSNALVALSSERKSPPMIRGFRNNPLKIMRREYKDSKTLPSPSAPVHVLIQIATMQSDGAFLALAFQEILPPLGMTDIQTSETAYATVQRLGHVLRYDENRHRAPRIDFCGSVSVSYGIFQYSKATFLHKIRPKVYYTLCQSPTAY